MVFDQCVEQPLWKTTRDTELRRPLTKEEEMRRKTGIPHEQIAHDRFWNKRPDGIAFKIPTKTKTGVICLLEFKRKSDVTSHHIVRAKRVAEAQYASQIGVSHNYATSGVEGRTSQFHHRNTVAQRRGDQEKLNLFRGPPLKYRTHPHATSYENI